MFPQGIFENLRIAMAILVLSEQFLSTLCIFCP